MRKVSAIVVGSIVALALAAAIERTGIWLYAGSVTRDVAAPDPAALAVLLGTMPLPMKIVVVIGWLIAPLAGVWLCLRIGDWAIGGWIVTGLFVVAAIAGQVSVPHPVWMQGCAVILPVIGGWLAQRLHRKPYPGEALLG